MSDNRKAFLDAIAASEIGAELLAISDNGYNILVGSTKRHPILFPTVDRLPDYRDHPRVYNRQFNSTAAGRYQILAHEWDHYKQLLHLKDFSPLSQDAVAIQMIKEFHGLPPIDLGDLDNAVALIARLWASLPGSPYGQHTNTMEFIKTAFTTAGGVLNVVT